MMLMNLRSAPSGALFVGENEGDTVLWDAAARKWKVGPGGGGGGVSSWNSRTGAVTPLAGDYDSDQVDNVSSVDGASVSDALDTLGGQLPSSYEETDEGPSGAAKTIDYSTGQPQRLLTITADALLTIVPPASARAFQLRLAFSGGPWTVSFTNAISYRGRVTYTPSNAGGSDVLTFEQLGAELIASFGLDYGA